MTGIGPSSCGGWRSFAEGWDGAILAYVLMGNHQGKDHAEKQAMGILVQGRERFGRETVGSMRQPHH
jgi:hypothetical protein